MEHLMVINGSPRAARSNSMLYAKLFQKAWKKEISVYSVTEKRHSEICATLSDFTDLLFIFPLYADGLPVTLMHFLKELEAHPAEKKPTIHVIINCGFFEPEQNQVACDMIQLFCLQNQYSFGSVLQIGSGEAILSTPFAFLVKRKMRTFAKALQRKRNVKLTVTLPITKKIFLKESTKYWLSYGAKNHISQQDMETMKIE